MLRSLPLTKRSMAMFVDSSFSRAHAPARMQRPSRSPPWQSSAEHLPSQAQIDSGAADVSMPEDVFSTLTAPMCIRLQRPATHTLGLHLLSGAVVTIADPALSA